MATEIERKFLVNSNVFLKEIYQKNYIKQGFLNSNKERVVRIRIKNDVDFLTIKGPSNTSGTARFEWEKEILLEEAQELFELCEKGIIEKYRYLVKNKNHVFEIDDFIGKNKGLIIAEIELSSENEVFKKPVWLGKEVTGEEKYYNSNLSKFPYKNW